MRTYYTDHIGKVILIHLNKGEDILESIYSEIQRLGIRNGILVSAIGSLRKTRLHYITTTNEISENHFLTLENPIELGSAQGLIIDGIPHFHLTVSDLKRVYTGHMEPGCEVQYLAELAILELPEANLTRKMDEFGISYLSPQNTEDTLS